MLDLKTTARDLGCEAAIGFADPTTALLTALTYSESRGDIQRITKHFLRAYTEHATRRLRAEARQLREERKYD